MSEANHGISIRPYETKDKDRLLEILTLLTPLYFAEEEIDDLRDYLEQEIDQYFVIERAGTVVGAGGIKVERELATGKLSWDFLHPDEQGLGLGSLLLNFRVERLLSMPDVKQITVRTSQMAYRFYEKNGFELLEVKKDFWAAGFDMYYMMYRQE